MAGAAAGSSASKPASTGTTPRSAHLESSILFHYVQMDDVSSLSGFKGNPHHVDKGGFNAMMVAAKYRRPHALKWCIENGVGRGRRG